MPNTLKEGREARLRAGAVELMSETDRTDWANCAREVKSSANLSDTETHIVTAALRDKLLPTVARQQFNLSDEDIKMLQATAEGSERHAFADDMETDDQDMPGDMPTHKGGAPAFEQPEEQFNDEIGEEVDDQGGDMTHLEIDVPNDKLNEAQEALRAILGDGAFDFGGEDDFGDDTDDDLEGDVVPSPTTAPDDTEKVMSMNKQSNASRAAQRKTILAKLDAAERTANEKPRDIGLGKDTSQGGKAFQYSDGAQMKGEAKAPVTTMQSSDGNSLKDQNPTYNDLDIYTNNPENLQLKDSVKTRKFEGSPSGDLDYVLQTEDFEVPSGDPDRPAMPSIPTQIPESAKRKTTVAQLLADLADLADDDEAGGFEDDMGFENGPGDDAIHHDDDNALPVHHQHQHHEDDPGDLGPMDEGMHEEEAYMGPDGGRMNRAQFEDHVIRTLEASGIEENVMARMSFAQGLELYDKITTRKAQNNSTIDNIRQIASDNHAKVTALAEQIKMEINGKDDDGGEEDDSLEKEAFVRETREKIASKLGMQAKLERKRTRIAYAVATRLVTAGVLGEDEVESQVDSWLNNNLTAQAMLEMGTLMLRTAHANSRVATAARVAPTRTAGISVNPTFTNPDNSAARDTRTALASLFSVGGISRKDYDRFEKERLTLDDTL